MFICWHPDSGHFYCSVYPQMFASSLSSVWNQTHTSARHHLVWFTLLRTHRHQGHIVASWLCWPAGLEKLYMVHSVSRVSSLSLHALLLCFSPCSDSWQVHCLQLFVHFKHHLLKILSLYSNLLNLNVNVKHLGGKMCFKLCHFMSVSKIV